MGCFDPRVSVAAEIRAEVIGNNPDDVWALGVENPDGKNECDQAAKNHGNEMPENN